MYPFRLGLVSSVAHLVGKLRRVALHQLRPAEVAAGHARRRGRCARCGACCRLLLDCPFLEGEPGETRCRIHDTRHTNCRIFPIDERDLADRDRVPGYGPCGYRFGTEVVEKGARPLRVVSAICPSCGQETPEREVGATRGRRRP